MRCFYSDATQQWLPSRKDFFFFLSQETIQIGVWITEKWRYMCQYFQALKPILRRTKSMWYIDCNQVFTDSLKKEKKFFSVWKEKLVEKELPEAFVQCHCPDNIICSTSKIYSWEIITDDADIPQGEFNMYFYLPEFFLSCYIIARRILV